VSAVANCENRKARRYAELEGWCNEVAYRYPWSFLTTVARFLPFHVQMDFEFCDDSDLEKPETFKSSAPMVMS